MRGSPADVGDEARLGSVMKLTGNFYIGAAIELIAEGMTMGERAGLSRETLLEYYSYMFPGGDAHDTHCGIPHPHAVRQFERRLLLA